jgi:anti-sigma regulatory factor (Ser/Thr protein kinase)
MAESLLDETFAADAAKLSRIRHLVEDATRARGLKAADAQRIGLAVTEACSNIIRHGYRDVPGGWIRLQLAVDGQRLVIVIDDDAPPVESAKIRPRDLDDLRPGGLGVHFIHEIMDDVRYETGPGGGNRLVMSRSL